MRKRVSYKEKKRWKLKNGKCVCVCVFFYILETIDAGENIC